MKVKNLMADSRVKLAVLVGPTASGKTAISVRVAQLLQAEIISGDSMQVYRGLDIGTAKITAAEMAGIPHHLLNTRDPKDDFSVADFREEAAAAIGNISKRGNLALLVGGSGLYIASLLNPYLFMPDSGGDEGFRKRMRQLALEQGDSFLHQRLADLDSAAAGRIHPHDHYRVVRALEVIEQTGRSISEIQEQSQTDYQMPYQVVMAGLRLKRELLYSRIEQRVDEMLQAGLVNEVKSLLQAGITEQSTSMRGLGYRHLSAYIRGLCTLEEAVTTLKRDTRRFAKRQITWFKRDQRIQWFDVEDYFLHNQYPCIEELAQDIAKWFKREES
ncbi:MAG: tRNA (adenosine(37)-N6)-dimethylallyltransferase MiaA [Clostridiales bacterium]|nr:tRNA (adenosine(37)-N6)-dimethylallyltransferase MiaA [Clostridiales bacterium]